MREGYIIVRSPPLGETGQVLCHCNRAVISHSLWTWDDRLEERKERIFFFPAEQWQILGSDVPGISPWVTFLSHIAELIFSRSFEASENSSLGYSS